MHTEANLNNMKSRCKSLKVFTSLHQYMPFPEGSQTG